ncbi:MAG: hypothetical protein KME26_25170 [Oscillatoria princeps RMCB-10]|nr:hypothetical protein [Oscillatoria princeps RMCB-10]
MFDSIPMQQDTPVETRDVASLPEPPVRLRTDNDLKACAAGATQWLSF